jgi:hypothetical protein
MNPGRRGRSVTGPAGPLLRAVRRRFAEQAPPLSPSADGRPAQPACRAFRRGVPARHARRLRRPCSQTRQLVADATACATIMGTYKHRQRTAWFTWQRDISKWFITSAGRVAARRGPQGADPARRCRPSFARSRVPGAGSGARSVDLWASASTPPDLRRILLWEGSAGTPAQGLERSLLQQSKNPLTDAGRTGASPLRKLVPYGASCAHPDDFRPKHSKTSRTRRRRASYPAGAGGRDREHGTDRLLVKLGPQHPSNTHLTHDGHAGRRGDV